MTSQNDESEKLTIEEPIVEPFMSFSEEPIEEPIEEPSIVGDVPIETSTDEHTFNPDEDPAEEIYLLPDPIDVLEDVPLSDGCPCDDCSADSTSECDSD